MIQHHRVHKIKNGRYMISGAKGDARARPNPARLADAEPSDRRPRRATVTGPDLLSATNSVSGQLTARTTSAAGACCRLTTIGVTVKRRRPLSVSLVSPASTARPPISRTPAGDTGIGYVEIDVALVPRRRRANP
jgi:hypothetical protein